MKAKSSGKSWQSRATLRSSAKAQRLNPFMTSGESGGETSNTCEEHIDTLKARAAEWFVHKCESNKDGGSNNYQTQNRVMVDQPVKVTQMISITNSTDRNDQR